MKMFKTLAFALLATGCGGQEVDDRVTVLEAEIADLRRDLTSCIIDYDDARFAVEACLYELDDTERRLARCKGGN